MKVTDYSAELHVSGRFANAGWNVYFPHRDEGFDFIISKDVEGVGEIIRPVQVKGKYPTSGKKNNPVYGYVGKLSKMHPDMVLAIPYYSLADPENPVFVAYSPISMIKKHSRGYRCQPAKYENEKPAMRPAFVKFFDEEGLKLVETTDWGTISVDESGA
jgi:hypothetical protein